MEARRAISAGRQSRDQALLAASTAAIGRCRWLHQRGARRSRRVLGAALAAFLAVLRHCTLADLLADEASLTESPTDARRCERRRSQARQRARGCACPPHRAATGPPPSPAS